MGMPPKLLIQWLQPGALVAGGAWAPGAAHQCFSRLGADRKGEMGAGEARVNRRVDEVKEESRR